MVQCELCGAETDTPVTVTIEEADLQVCDDCRDLGTDVETDAGGGSTKYDTGGGTTDSSSSSGSGSGSSSRSGGRSGGGGGEGGGGSGGSDPFDDLDDIDPEYGTIIREAREGRGLSQADLADMLNEKASLIRKIEREETLPSDAVQRELEGELEIDLAAGGAAGEDGDWRAEAASGGTTLGDIVERSDS
jgi:putative transcription factor